MRSIWTILLFFLLSRGLSNGQDTRNDMPAHSEPNQTTQGMPGMSRMRNQTMSMESHTLIELLQHHATSGTDAEPNSTPFEMLMTMKGSWTFMFHGEAFLNEIQQSGPRGADKLFS